MTDSLEIIDEISRSVVSNVSLSQPELSGSRPSNQINSLSGHIDLPRIDIPNIDNPTQFPNISFDSPTKETNSTTKRSNNGLVKSLTKLLLSSSTKSLVLSKRNTLSLEFIHTQYTFNCLVQAFLAVMSILSGITEYEHTVLKVEKTDIYYHTHKIDYNLINEYKLDEHYFINCRNTAMTTTYFTFVCSILLWIAVFFDTVLYKQILTSSIEKNYKEFFGGRDILIFIINIILILPTPTPMTFGIDCPIYNDNFKVDYFIPLNSIFMGLSLFRLLYIFKFYLISSTAYSQRAFRFCKINNVQFSLTFPFKVNMAKAPLLVIAQLFIISFLICSYNIRIYERYLDSYTQKNFGNLLNDLWYIFITMTTVGYGDLFSTTIFGRIFTIIGCMIGVFLVSFSVVCVYNYLNIDGIELNVYNVIEKSGLMDERQGNAESLVYNFMVARKINLKKDNEKDVHTNVSKKYRKKLKDIFEKYRNSGKKLETISPSFSTFDSVTEYLKFLEERIEKNRNKIEYMDSELDFIQGKMSKIMRVLNVH